VTWGGEQGEEPPGRYKEIVQRLWDLHNLFTAEPDLNKRIEYENEMFDIHAQELLLVTPLMRPENLRQDFYHYYTNRMKNVAIPSGAETAYSVPAQWAIQE
jgi:hypothetical protein